MENKCGVIYIFTNPSFPEYVKIGYADDEKLRLEQLNRSSATPFAFRLYAKYEVENRLDDLKIHSIIDTLNPSLRSIDVINGKKRVREFFCMSKEKAYSIFESIALISGTKDRLTLCETSINDIKQEEEAELIRIKKSKTKFPKIDWLIKNNILNINDQVCLINHLDKIGIVFNEKGDILYNNEVMSLNKYACLVTGWDNIQAYAYIKKIDSDYTLAEMRLAKMKELDMID